MAHLVQLNGTPVAFTGATRYFLLPEIEDRPIGDALRQVVVLMCAYAHRLDTSGRAGGYSDDDAKDFARVALEIAGTDAAVIERACAGSCRVSEHLPKG